MAHQIGLQLNHRKSESICVDDTTRSSILSLFPSLTNTPPEVATLLGSPIGGIDSIDGVIRDKVDDLRTLGERLILLQAHDALCLLKNAMPFSLPKLLYTIRSAPCFQSDFLEDFDNLQRSLLESICNINLVDSAWLQASLPATSGGLGVRSAVMLAPSAYLASAAGCAHLYQGLLPERLHSQDAAIRGHALKAWSAMLASEADPPTGAEAILQRNWDGPVVKSHFNSLLSSADPKGKTRLLACQQKESGDWLSAPPTSALGLCMVNDTIRVVVGLRLGAQLCATHSLAVGEVKAGFHAMQDLTTLSTGHSQLPTSQQLWSLEVSAVWMGSDLTALPSSPGQRGEPWSGMSRAGTLLRPPTYACLHLGLGRLLITLLKGRGHCTRSYLSHTSSNQ